MATFSTNNVNRDNGSNNPIATKRLSSVNSKLLKKLAVNTLFALSTLSVSMLASAENFVAGKDYTVLKNAQKIDTNRVIVREFFWYGCPHCYHLDPHAHTWKKTKAKDVAFFHTPAPFNRTWEQSAKGFYAAQALGVADKAHVALFEAIHKNNQELFDQNSLANFYSKFGADKKKFNDLFSSFAVGSKVGKAKQASINYKLSGVPAVVVQGKYVVKGSDARTFKVVDFLVNKVRKEELNK